jgi:predicted DNA-binding protein (UPF0251 family)
MARPEKKRNVLAPPAFNKFKPAGIKMHKLEREELSLDEYEALRLADYDGLEHSDAALKMGISRPTFTRLISKARQKVAKFIVDGKVLQIDGGSVHFSQNTIICLDCKKRYPGNFIDNFEYSCPECGSKNAENLAEGFGHGRCCGHYKKSNQK